MEIRVSLLPSLPQDRGRELPERGLAPCCLNNEARAPVSYDFDSRHKAPHVHSRSKLNVFIMDNSGFQSDVREVTSRSTYFPQMSSIINFSKNHSDALKLMMGRHAGFTTKADMQTKKPVR